MRAPQSSFSPSSATVPPVPCDWLSCASRRDSPISLKARSAGAGQTGDSMIRSTVARVDLAALQSNFQAIQQFLSDQSRTPPSIIAVVKANAYGHGSERVGLALEQAGATMLACADIEEGIVLRRAGVRLPILVFGALSVSHLDGLFEYALTPTISTPSAARAVQAAAAKRQATCGYHLKIDTGMNRLGFRYDNLLRTLPDVLRSANLRLEGVYT